MCVYTITRGWYLLVYTIACPPECSSGLMQCYGPDMICCNFYDEDNNCLAECNPELNMEVDENYTCTCEGFYGPPGDCSCKLLIHNNLTQYC